MFFYVVNVWLLVVFFYCIVFIGYFVVEFDEVGVRWIVWIWNEDVVFRVEECIKEELKCFGDGSCDVDVIGGDVYVVFFFFMLDDGFFYFGEIFIWFVVVVVFFYGFVVCFFYVFWWLEVVFFGVVYVEFDYFDVFFFKFFCWEDDIFYGVFNVYCFFGRFDYVNYYLLLRCLL